MSIDPPLILKHENGLQDHRLAHPKPFGGAADVDESNISFSVAVQRR
jgi:hypothetical protein